MIYCIDLVQHDHNNTLTKAIETRNRPPKLFELLCKPTSLNKTDNKILIIYYVYQKRSL